jgi:rare lipoprotein A
MKYLLILGLLSLTTTLSAQLIGETENGLASYYSNEYQGAETAYGVIYDRNDLVAAHRLYPQNSVVKVRNAENGKTVNVRIIDKGPFIRGRIIELSERAAANIGLLGKETVPVEPTRLPGWR